MQDPIDTAEAYEPEPYYGRRYEPDRELRIRWGRVVGLVGALILGLLIGRAMAPEGVSEERLQAAQDELAAARAEIDRLETRLAEAPAPGAATTPAPATTASPAGSPAPATSPAPSPAATASPRPPSSSEPRTYTVQAGDSLWTIAKKFYGDANLATFLAQANNLPDKSLVKTGQKLTIPPKPTSTPSPAPTRTP